MNYDKILQAILDIGEEMLVCGAEVNRVEDSIYRMCESYKADRINVFIITSNIQVTIEAPDGRIITQIRRVTRYSVNFDKLDYLNDLSRHVCSHNLLPHEIEEKLEEVMSRKEPSKLVDLIGSVLVAAGFAVFFGGSAMDGAAAAIMGCIITIAGHVLIKRERNQLVFNFVISIIAGVAAIFLVRIGIGHNLDKILIGGIMLLIPGIAMTNSVRDMIIGDIASGLLRLVNSLLVAATLACGFVVAIVLLGGNITVSNNCPIAVQLVAAFFGSIGFAIVLKIKGKQVVYAGIGGLLTWALYLYAYSLIPSYFGANFFAAVFVAVYAEIMAKVNKAPATIFLTAAAIPLIPGGSLYYAMYGVVTRDAEMIDTNGTNAILIALAIALGFVVVAVVNNRVFRRNDRKIKY